MVTRSVIGGEDRVLNRFLRGISLYLLIAIIVVTLASSMYSPRAYERELYYSELLRLIDQNQVASVRMIGDQQISGVLRDGTPFVSIVPMGKMSDIADRLEEECTDRCRTAPDHALVGGVNSQYHIYCRISFGCLL